MSLANKLARDAVESFEVAEDEMAQAIASNWRGRIVELDVIDTGTYLSAVRVTDTEESGEVRTVTIEAPEASGYAAAIRRKGESDYVGQRVAEQGVEKSEAAIGAILDRAGGRLK